jgi:hypothetical protein
MRQFWQLRVLYRGLAKNTMQLHAHLARSFLWMISRSLLREAREGVRLQWSK